MLGPVDTARFIGGRIRRDNNPTPGRADVFLSEAVPVKGLRSLFSEIRILFYRAAVGQMCAPPLPAFPTYQVPVRANWRVIFRFDGNSHDVDYVDYH